MHKNYFFEGNNISNLISIGSDLNGLLRVVRVIFSSPGEEVAPLLDEEQVWRRRKIFSVGQESVEVRDVIFGGVEKFRVDRFQDQNPAKLRIGQEVVGQDRVQFFPGFCGGLGKLLVVVPRRQRVEGLLQHGPDLQKVSVRLSQAVFSVQTCDFLEIQWHK